MRSRHEFGRLTSRRRRRSLPRLIEALEPRRLFAVSLVNQQLTLTGAGGAASDTLRVDIIGSDYRITDNGIVHFFANSSVASIIIDAGDGADTIYIDALTDAVTVNGGAGDDQLNLGISSDLSAITASVTFNGGGDFDALQLWDSASGGSEDYFFVNGLIARTGGFGGVIYQDNEYIQLSAQAGSNEISINALQPSVQLNVYAGAGDDNITLGTGLLDSVAGKVYVTGQDGSDIITLNDSADALEPDYTITATNVSSTAGFGGLTHQQTEGLVLHASAGSNQFNVASTHASQPVTINGGAGDDQLVCGSGNLDLLDAKLTFNGGAGSDDATLNDASTSVARTYKVNATSVQFPTSADFGGFHHGTVESVRLNGSQGSSHYTVSATAADATFNLNAAGGDDTFLLGEGLLDGIAGELNISGGAGYDAIAVDDSYTTDSHTYFITAQTVQRTLFGSLIYGDAEFLSVHAGTGNDVVFLDGATATTPTTLYTGAGDDLVFVASQSADLDSVPGVHTIVAGAGTDALSIHDEQSHSVSGWEITPELVTRDSAGSDVNTVIAYHQFESLGVQGGQALDTFVVNGTHEDTPVTVDPGPSAFDTIYVNDTDATAPVTVAPSKGDGAVVVVNHDGAGKAHVKFEQSQRISALSVFSGGAATLEPQAGVLLHVIHTLNLTGTARLDLADNDLAVNYDAVSPIGTSNGTTYTGLAGLIQSGRNDGAWDGAGIVTSMADAQGGLTTLAVAEAAEVLSITGAQTEVFSGGTVDGTTVLIKYTYAGDANLDGVISGDDYSSIDFNLEVPGASGYFNGDFNYDGIISGDDYSTIDFNILAQGAPL